ncbi:rab11-binding protein relch [Holotrichia oblita]|uniref:Rab11-binding protein relch n=1 Tax=Holotrichia oblita TaxID=644536 RepID=A0ACB9TT08_HOLOL|nr:rab11-binding protein relch [Holotrichia oblita]
MSAGNILEHVKNSVQNNLPTYQDIATKLLTDKLLLTALELHTELVESGKEVRLLKDFFSNPGNFELHTYEHTLPRSGSQATLDSLDLTRYSEDGEQSIDERVAVLEFQLRKAKETINALRNNLTVATESENNTPNKCAPHHLNSENIKPHEQRALNFLINEYLLSHGYKLTSITFSDENENQDFEDWDDVGLNISKPPELLTLYREGLKQTGHTLVTIECQTDGLQDYDNLKQNVKDMVVELNEKNVKLNQMESQICALQNEIMDCKKQNDLLLYNQRNYLLNDNISDIPKQTISVSSKNSTIGSNSPEHFEIIDKSNILSKTEEGIVSLDDNISSNSFNETDWNDVTINTNESYIENIPMSTEKISLLDVLDSKSRNVPSMLKNELLSLCPVNIFQKIDNDILNVILTNGVSPDKIVDIISQSLLRIIPNIILNKREEAVPLLVSAVLLCNDPSMRDKLLQQLFNLKKKPSDSERTLILLGITAIAKFSQESLVENEVLPQCWEQLAHKYLERRLLVAESCIALIPYVSDSIRNSLILSMLQQMLEDREETVRNMVVHALALVVVLCVDKDKYNQCEELAFSILKDSSPIVATSDTQVLFPVLAKWALELDYFKTHLLKNLLYKLNDYLKIIKQESPSRSSGYSDLVVKLLAVLDHLLPHIFVYVINVSNVIDRIDKDAKIEIRQDLLNLCTSLTNPNNFLKTESNIGAVIYEFDVLAEKNPEVSWNETDWLLDNVIPDLLNNLSHVETTNHLQMQHFIDLFSHFCIVFGKHFTKHKIAPIFRVHIENLEQILSNFNQYCPSLNIIPVYLVSVLSNCDKDEIGTILKKFVCALPLCGTPLDCLEMTVKGLCDKGLQEIVVVSLWEAVVHQRPLVRAASAGLFSAVIKLCNEVLLCTKVTPAIVTLANDSDILVRTATVPALGCLITDCKVKEVHDKAYMQLETYLSDTNVLENHTLIRQLIVTMGNIVLSCKISFKDEVIFPKLHYLSSYTYQMTNQTRKVDMAAALIEAYSKILLCGTLESYKVTTYIIPGLRYLEFVVKENPSLLSHYDVIMSMNKQLESKMEVSTTQHHTDRASNIHRANTQSVEDVRQKVSKIFNNPVVNKSTTLPNLQGIFKKK